MLSLLIRNLFFTVVQPGVVGVLIPYLILRGRGLFPETWAVTHIVGAVLIVIGTTIVLTCVLRFVTEGKGTISPLDPTTRLVVRGLYRYSRNPMYLGMMLLLSGQALFWWSPAMAIYAAVVFAIFHLFILLHEEPRLRRVFGPEYDAYTSTVRRWI